MWEMWDYVRNSHTWAYPKKLSKPSFYNICKNKNCILVLDPAKFAGSDPETWEKVGAELKSSALNAVIKAWWMIGHRIMPSILRCQYCHTL